MSTAFITGVNGQDGSLLAELLLAKGYSVVGGVRKKQGRPNSLSLSLEDKVELVEWDMMDQSRMEKILLRYRPTEFYNLAAYASGAGMYDAPVEIGEINGLAVARMLEAIRASGLSVRFCQASSREIFGEAEESPQSEYTPANPRSPYGAAKLYADMMVRIYRQRYGMFACSAILFNHESPRRGTEFVTRKITREVAKIKLGLSSGLQLGNLDARRDWGFAGDFVRAMWLMLQHSEACDYVVATGKTHSVREFCESAFGYLDLDYRDYVREDKSEFRPTEPVELVGDAGKARRVLQWEPEVRFDELVRMMVDADVLDLTNKHAT